MKLSEGCQPEIVPLFVQSLEAWGRGLMIVQLVGMGVKAGPPARGLSGIAVVRVGRITAMMVERCIVVDVGM